jgi:hypothetical protein
MARNHQESLEAKAREQQEQARNQNERLEAHVTELKSQLAILQAERDAARNGAEAVADAGSAWQVRAKEVAENAAAKDAHAAAREAGTRPVTLYVFYFWCHFELHGFFLRFFPCHQQLLCYRFICHCTISVYIYIYIHIFIMYIYMYIYIYIKLMSVFLLVHICNMER